MPKKRKWTNKEHAKLYKYSKIISQKEAAQKLDRTYRAVRSRCIKLGIKWSYGLWSVRAIAGACGCSEKYAKKFIAKTLEGGIPGTGKGSGFRARISDEDAKWLIGALKKQYEEEPPRSWPRSDKIKLYSYAGKMSIPDAAKLMGRSEDTVLKMASSMGIRWRQGTRSVRSIAIETDADAYDVKKALKALFPGRSFHYGDGVGKRYLIGYEEADRLVQFLKGASNEHKEDS